MASKSYTFPLSTLVGAGMAAVASAFTLGYFIGKKQSAATNDAASLVESNYEDTDKNGEVSRDELSAALKKGLAGRGTKYSLQAVFERNNIKPLFIFDTLDKDKNQRISFDEFLAACKKG